MSITTKTEESIDKMAKELGEQGEEFKDFVKKSVSRRDEITKNYSLIRSMYVVIEIFDNKDGKYNSITAKIDALLAFLVSAEEKGVLKILIDKNGDRIEDKKLKE